MKACRRNKRLFIEYISEGISPEREKKFLEHLEECKDCRDAIIIHKKLSDPHVDIPVPDPTVFNKMRSKVIKSIESEEIGIFESWYSNISEKFINFSYNPIAATVILCLVFTIGFLTSWIFINGKEFSKAELVENIKHSALSNSGLREVEDSPYTFSNVRFREVDDKNIALSFNVSTHMDIIRKKDDPVVKEVLAQTLLNSEPLGTRLKSVSISKDIIDPKIKEALIFTLHNDNNLAVRMRAMSALMKYSEDNKIQEAFLQLLKEEESVNMRLLAIEYLAKENIDKQILQNATINLNRNRDTAIKNRINQYLNLDEINNIREIKK